MIGVDFQLSDQSRLEPGRSHSWLERRNLPCLLQAMLMYAENFVSFNLDTKICDHLLLFKLFDHKTMIRYLDCPCQLSQGYHAWKQFHRCLSYILLRWMFLLRLLIKHRHRRNVTSHHFTSLLFTSFHFYVYSNFFGSYQLKANTIYIHISKNSTFPFISLHFSLSLLLSIEGNKSSLHSPLWLFSLL